MWLLKNLVKLVKTNVPLCMYMPPESSDKVDNKMEIKTKENCSEKLLIKSRGKKKNQQRARLMGGRQVASPVPLEHSLQSSS